ncbi:hypothetical protein GCM10025868_17690 [Angustibacter aerolatus]|uniref:MIP18 family-like domain-containing protein n=1 Tax=Angustibacter aerolatus TaxID=1162965 RepID=A0ABQ6JFD7_9ACTN|nr:hypothetical protein GCM10025868_17690 [Angustibacter aerolatus]
MLTLADLGVLRSVELDGEHLVVTITPTYTGCPAMATMRADLLVALRRNGFDDVEVRTSLSPAWSTDWLTERGRRALAEHGIAPPGPARPASSGPVPLVLGTRAPSVRCPRCGSLDTREPVALRIDRLQVAARVPRLRGALRPLQGAWRDHRGAEPGTGGSRRVPPAVRGPRRAVVRRRRSRDLRRAGRAWPRSSPSGPGSR